MVWRWVPMLIISILLHLILIGSISGMIEFPNTDASQAYRAPEVVAVTLIAPPPEPQVITPESPKIKPRPKRVKQASSPVPESPTSPVATPETAMANATDTEAETTSTESTESIDTTKQHNAPAATETASQNTPAYRIALLPSAKLKFDIEKTPVNGATMHGSGTIDWQTDQHQYAINGDFGVLFITALRVKSTGKIESSAIAPELYAEKRMRRSETNTHFHRERQTISFSASTASYPRLGNEQDRASIIWQMAAIGRGDADHFQPGATIPVVVAGTRDASQWQITVIGMEEIEIDGKQMTTWRLQRAPRSGSYDQTLEFWLAPEIGWYPVRLRYTEPNGDVLDMVMRSLNVYPTP